MRIGSASGIAGHGEFSLNCPVPDGETLPSVLHCYFRQNQNVLCPGSLIILPLQHDTTGSCELTNLLRQTKGENFEINENMCLVASSVSLGARKIKRLLIWRFWAVCLIFLMYTSSIFLAYTKKYF